MSLFFSGDSKSRIPDAILKCEPIIWGTTDNDLRIKLTRFIKLDKGRERGMIYFFNDRDGEVTIYDIEINVYAYGNMKSLLFTYIDTLETVTLDRETLILDSGNESQCLIMPSSKTINEYLQAHKRIYKSELDDEIREQIKKNKL